MRCGDVSPMVVEDLLQANMFLSYRSSEEKRCDVKQQTYEEKRVLHICTFPSSDVFMYVEMHLRVIDRDTNTTIYNRTVSVEDQRKCNRRTTTIYFEVLLLIELKWNISVCLSPSFSVSSNKYFPSSNWRRGPNVSWMEKNKTISNEHAVWNSLQIQKHIKHS